MAEATAYKADRSLLLIGAVAAAFGLYFILMGFGLLPEPSKRNAPLWIGIPACLAFFCAGACVIVRGLLGLNDKQSDLPDDAPLWMKAVYYFAGTVAAGGLASVGSWVAFGGGTRHFNMSVSGFMSGSVSEGIGRTLFGFGAIMVWLMVIALARRSARKVFGKKAPAPSP
jgi:hypothetical protein